MSWGNNQGGIKDKVSYVKNALVDPNNKHTCHWPGCFASVKPTFWGCMHHWYTLPAWARAMIWATYNPMQEIKKTPSKAYLLVAEKIQIWIIATEVWATIRPMVESGNYQNLGTEFIPL